MCGSWMDQNIQLHLLCYCFGLPHIDSQFDVIRLYVFITQLSKKCILVDEVL